jgi:hypothetical protein
MTDILPDRDALSQMMSTKAGEFHLSASITCRLRKQSLYAYLTEVITAHARGDPIPALS